MWCWGIFRCIRRQQPTPCLLLATHGPLLLQVSVGLVSADRDMACLKIQRPGHFPATHGPLISVGLVFSRPTQHIPPRTTIPAREQSPAGCVHARHLPTETPAPARLTRRAMDGTAG